jgi:hypothetical protein
MEETMSRYRSMKKKIVELYDERSGKVIRTISFDTPKQFDAFLKDFQLMRYPGYQWRYKERATKKQDVPSAVPEK